MTPGDAGRTIAGVDGCKAGWVAAVKHPDSAPEIAVHTSFADLLAALPADAVVAVDMPIGLPDVTTEGGRGPERLIRPLLGARRSSVFSIPSRAAVHAEPGPFGSVKDWHAAHRRASAVALQTSNPPRGVSIQAFGIFSKIREIDALLIAKPALRGRVFESHPEAAFWRLNGEMPVVTPKKVSGRVNPAGMEERKALLLRHGLPHALLDRAPPRGAAADDMLDACALLFTAQRIANGSARPFPDPPGRDSHGIPIAIWV